MNHPRTVVAVVAAASFWAGMFAAGVAQGIQGARGRPDESTIRRWVKAAANAPTAEQWEALADRLPDASTPTEIG